MVSVYVEALFFSSRRRHTRFDCDWSSDVCSSDLLCGTFRKIHLPGTKAPDGFAQVFEPYYFAHGDTGYKVFDAAGARVGIAICQDRRYPESYRALALQGAEVILVGYNTPSSPLALDLNELCLRSGAYANLCFVVGVAKAGVEDGVELIAGSAIVSPLGQVLARAATNGDELVVARIRSEEHTSELQSQSNLVCRLLLEKKKTILRRQLRPASAPLALSH